MNHVDHRLLLLMAEDDGAEHDLLGQFLGFRLDHEHRGLGARDHEIELRRRRELGLARIQHVLAVDIADTRRADRSTERNA